MSDHRDRHRASRAGRSPSRRRIADRCAALADGLFAFLVGLSGVIALSPFTGIAVAREEVAARRHRRATIAAIRETQSAVWVRQALRNDRAWAYTNPLWY